MKKLAALALVTLGLAACEGTGDRTYNMPTIEDTLPQTTITQDSTNTINNDAYRNDTGSSGLTTDTSTNPR